MHSKVLCQQEVHTFSIFEKQFFGFDCQVSKFNLVDSFHPLHARKTRWWKIIDDSVPHTFESRPIVITLFRKRAESFQNDTENETLNDTSHSSLTYLSIHRVKSEGVWCVSMPACIGKMNVCLSVISHVYECHHCNCCFLNVEERPPTQEWCIHISMTIIMV